ncbi:MAG: sigma-E processing peptidase SpoIIGA [Dorea sp.]|nr:sigma-E processing peptidase SpoIIGA [Dorea sp.]
MYYELYIDVFFAVNFMMDSMILTMTRKILGGTVTYRRIFAGAFLGSLLTCLVIVLPIPATFIKLVLFHGLVNVVMIRTGLGIPAGQGLLKAWIVLYISGFLTGGVFQFFQQYLRSGSLFFLLAVVSYYVVSAIWETICYLSRKRNGRCKVILYLNERSCEVDALIDTGNSLKDPLTGKAVSVISQDTAKKLISAKENPTFRYIPYHSIGKAEGVMPMIVLNGMTVIGKEEQWIEKPLAAICENELTVERFQMILNPDVLVGGIDYGNKSSSTSSI